MTDKRAASRESIATESNPTKSPVRDAPDALVEETSLPEPADSSDSADERESGDNDADAPPRRRVISVGVRSLVVSIGIAALVVAVGVMTWLYISAQGKLDAQAKEGADDAHAEKIGLDYSVNAATMDFKNLDGWKVNLVAGTSPELNKKLTDAVGSMQQVLVPLEWTSTARPLAAKVHSVSNGIYVVDCFVSVQTKTVQAPDALQSTATYSVTIDRNKGWQITDVGGVGSALGQK